MTEKEFYKNIGQKIREFRKEKGLTQKQVAEKAEIHQSDLATFEGKGERIKSADIIRRIIEATGHTMADLFPSEPLPEKKTPHPSPRSSGRFKSLTGLSMA